MKRISDKRKALLPEYYTLVSGLVDLCRNKSELSGMSPDWQSGFVVDPHPKWCYPIFSHFYTPFNFLRHLSHTDLPLTSRSGYSGNNGLAPHISHLSCFWLISLPNSVFSDNFKQSFFANFHPLNLTLISSCLVIYTPLLTK